MAMDKKKILLVDDDADFLSTASALLDERCEQAWEFLPAHSGGEALTILQDKAVDLMLLDVRMPVLDGVQLLALLQRQWPSLTKVVLTGEATEDERTSCLKCGAEMVLEKPTAPDGWQSIHAVVDSLLQASKEKGFQGVMRQVSLQDVIQMECLSANSSILEVKGVGLKGQVFIRDGGIVHATIGDLAGVPALNEILGLPGGGFRLLPFEDPGRTSIEGSWEFLLMEAAQHQDEVSGDLAGKRAGKDATKPKEIPTDLESIPDMFRVSGTHKEPAPAPTETALDTECIPDLFKAPATNHHNDKPSEAKEAAKAALQEPLQREPKPTIEESLICSLQGNLLYQWQSPDPQSRISLLEFLTRRAASLSAALPLGQFERFEAVDDERRCLVKLHADRALFIRVINPSPIEADSQTP